MNDTLVKYFSFLSIIKSLLLGNNTPHILRDAIYLQKNHKLFQNTKQHFQKTSIFVNVLLSLYTNNFLYERYNIKLFSVLIKHKKTIYQSTILIIQQNQKLINRILQHIVRLIHVYFLVLLPPHLLLIFLFLLFLPALCH